VSGGGQKISKSFLLMAVVLAVTTLPLLGCADHIFRSFNIDHAESLSVDARQRVVLVTHKGGKTRDRTIVCTEPQPDIVKAGATAGRAVASVPPADPSKGTQVAVTSAAGEATALIALRSQTIQLLRDGLYRACEAYMNGAIDQHQYNIVLLNIDKLMITLLGVDAIGTIQSRDQNLGGVASDTKEIQADALTDILFAANAQSSAPALCISLLASGELRLDNPGQQALLVRCDYLLAGTFEHLVRQREGAAARDGALAALKAPLPNKTSIGAGEQSASHIGTWTTSTALMNAEQHESVAAWRAWDQWTVQFP
jgi:hypothetical protein